MKPKLRGLIFDLDGTLVELKFQVSDAKAAVIEDLRRLGFDTSRMSNGEPTQMILDKVAVQLQKQRRGDSFSTLRARADKILNKFEMQAFRSTKLLPGAKLILSYLKHHGFKLGIVTNNGTVPSKMTIKRLAVSDSFDVVITRDDVRRMKPAGEGIKKAIRRLGLRSHQCLYIGDSFVDILAARDAGVKIVSLMRRDSAGKILRYSPDYLITSLKQLPLLLQSHR